MTDDNGPVFAPAKILGNQEAQRLADKLFQHYGSDHINFNKVYAVVSERPASFSILYKDDIPVWMHDLTVYGLAIDSKGPRGGKGWKRAGIKSNY
ncbi:hypothetical protein [Microbulbifer epialgicus]|uniref:Uncharacterized protein n=1 Tax=Microbulbifer epialgicus TaxID=393907 RepID=A0ABV4P4D5_9GAMM